MVNKKTSRRGTEGSRSRPTAKGKAAPKRKATRSPGGTGASNPSASRRSTTDHARLDRTFAALADPTRRAILQRLAEDDGLPAGRLAEPFRMSWPAVSKHLRVLENAGLLRQEKDGRVRRCHLEPTPLKEASEWVAFYKQFWTEQLDSLASFLEGQG